MFSSPNWECVLLVTRDRDQTSIRPKTESPATKNSLTQMPIALQCEFGRLENGNVEAIKESDMGEWWGGQAGMPGKDRRKGENSH